MVPMTVTERQIAGPALREFFYLFMDPNRSEVVQRIEKSKQE
jgi:hypothetical protein